MKKVSLKFAGNYNLRDNFFLFGKNTETRRRTNRVTCISKKNINGHKTIRTSKHVFTKTFDCIDTLALVDTSAGINSFLHNPRKILLYYPAFFNSCSQWQYLKDHDVGYYKSKSKFGVVDCETQNKANAFSIKKRHTHKPNCPIVKENFIVLYDVMTTCVMSVQRIQSKLFKMSCPTLLCHKSTYKMY